MTSICKACPGVTDPYAHYQEVELDKFYSIQGSRFEMAEKILRRIRQKCYQYNYRGDSKSSKPKA